ncbi:MAG: HEPN domain-containing protein [bacterium]|nr:HEPN domain-containing protein [bacterium]
MKEGTRKLLAKAERTLEAARGLLDLDHPDSAAGRLYYAMFYVAEALLYDQDLEFSKHSAVHAAYGKHFAKTGVLDPRFHRWLLDAFNTRLQTDYGFDMIPSVSAVETMLTQATAFLTAAREYLESTRDDLEARRP